MPTPVRLSTKLGASLTYNALTGLYEVSADVLAAIEAAVAAQSEIWPPPSTPHASNIEFNSLTLPAQLVFSDHTLAALTVARAPLNPFVHLTTPPLTYQLHTEARASWLVMQLARSASPRFVHFPVTPTTDWCAWVRVSATAIVGSDQQASTNYDNEVGTRYCIWANNAGKPDLQNYLFIEVRVNGATTNSAIVLIGQVIAGVETFLPLSTAASARTWTNFAINSYTYFGFRKVGTNYGFYASRGDGSYIDLTSNSSQNSVAGGAAVFTPTVAHCGLRLWHGLQARVAARFGVDFFRFKDDANALPW